MTNEQKKSNINNLGDLLNSCNEMHIYFFEEQINKKGGGYKIYLFPNESTQETILDYQSNFKFYVENKDVVEYSETDSKKETIQKMPCAELPQWDVFKELIDNLDITNAPIFKAENISNAIKCVVVECIVNDSPVYLLSKFSYSVTYKRAMHFSITNNTFKKVKRDKIFSFGNCIDCFIYDNNVYILIESHFDSLFKFYKRIRDEVDKNITEIDEWDFFDNNHIQQDIIGKPRKCRQFLKVIRSGNLATWKNISPTERKNIILSVPMLKDKFIFNEQDRMVYSKDALNELFKLLTNDYFKSIITGETGER